MGKGITFEAFTLSLTQATGPQLLLGADPSRLRANVKASATDVFIGQKGQLINALGYLLPSSAAGNSTADVICTTDDVYVAYTPQTPNSDTVYVTVWIERDSAYKPNEIFEQKAPKPVPVEEVVTDGGPQ